MSQPIKPSCLFKFFSLTAACRSLTVEIMTSQAHLWTHTHTHTYANAYHTHKDQSLDPSDCLHLYLCFHIFFFFSVCKRQENKNINHMNILSLSTKYAAYQHWTLGTRVSHAHTHVNTPRCNGNMEVILYTYSMEPYAPLGMQHAISCTKLMEEGKTRRCTIRRLMKSQKHSNTLRGSLWTKLCWFCTQSLFHFPDQTQALY